MSQQRYVINVVLQHNMIVAEHLLKVSEFQLEIKDIDLGLKGTTCIYDSLAI